jgi:hypothetical protein
VEYDWEKSDSHPADRMGLELRYEKITELTDEYDRCSEGTESGQDDLVGSP